MRCRVLLLLLATAAVPAPVATQPTYSNPVLPGDHPDPSVIRVGDDYWATATTSQWAPIFPLLHSRDLVNWEQVGAVFEAPPAWSSGSYWAPEIATDGRRFFVYYTARRKNGPLCIAVATASRPQGPYRDHGPMLCQEAGSIDAVPVDDERGTRYLVWKEDGNSRKQPTPLWAQRLSPDGTRLVGERHELLRNEVPWEAHLIEGPFILKRGEWFYMFYSADACCGRQCNYKLGVARAKALLGPWERHAINPILAGNDDWKCPGHGSVVSTEDGRDFLLYHGYHAGDFQFAGRQGLLDEITWGPDGWPVINGGGGPRDKGPAPLGVAARPRVRELADDLAGPALQQGWQWPWNEVPRWRFAAGALVLRAPTDAAASATSAVLARPTRFGNYTATVRVAGPPARDGAMVGLAAYGDAGNALGIAATSTGIVLWVREKGEQRTLTQVGLDTASQVDLRIAAEDGRRFRFAYSTDGESWHRVGDETDGAYLPPWDRAVRVALAVGGAPGLEGRFDWIRIVEGSDSP